jgi:steroid 5-alpha reductase family enzyme
MEKADWEALIALPVILGVGGLLAWAGSQHGISLAGWPVYAWCVALAFSIQWIAFIPAYLKQSEKYYDLIGSLTYLSVLGTGIGFSTPKDLRSLILSVLIACWALRLGSFLFLRIHAVGEDSRFREIKPHFFRFLMAWTLQGLWVCFSLAAALAAITTTNLVPFGAWGIVGVAIWLTGFAFEAIADHQKSQFRKEPKNKGTFIHTGLWARSRHPNYFGEIVIWIGIAVIAFPALQDWQWATLISPVFVTLLLTRISGVPMLEEKADSKWGGQPDYEAYKANTPVLIPSLLKKP